jgi:DNA-binding NarL/FixJ family response regulator
LPDNGERERESAGMTVLVVDDSHLVRRSLVAYLGEVPAVSRVSEAQDPASASEALRRVNPDVVILDLHMPGGSGFDVLRDIREAEQEPLVIVFTNHAEEAYRKRCLEDGAHFFFDKARDLPRMIEVLREHGSTDHS